MPAPLQFFDMSVSMEPPNGHLEPMPITLGPNWQPNDIRLMFLTATGAGSSGDLDMSMTPNPPTSFTAAYSLNPSSETHGVWYRRLVAGDNSTGVYWPRPPGWRHFMVGFVTVRGASPTAAVTAGSLSDPGDLTYAMNDSSTAVTVSSVTVPTAGAMVFFVGDVLSPERSPWPNWPVSLGVPTGWTNLAATDKSGDTFYQYGTDPALIMVAKSYASSGSTGSVDIPVAQGSPAFIGLYAFLTPGADVSVAIGAA